MRANKDKSVGDTNYNNKSSYNCYDIFNLDEQLKEEERLIKESTRTYAKKKLMQNIFIEKTVLVEAQLLFLVLKNH